MTQEGDGVGDVECGMKSGDLTPSSIKELVTLDDSLFTLPPNVKLISIYEMSEGFKKSRE